MFGILERDIDYIMKALEMFDEIESALIFGSRAMGNYKKGSDIDMAISGQLVTRETIAKLNDFLSEQYPIPYFFDILHLEAINNEQLLEQIQTFGIEVYRKGS